MEQGVSRAAAGRSFAYFCVDAGGTDLGKPWARARKETAKTMAVSFAPLDPERGKASSTANRVILQSLPTSKAGLAAEETAPGPPVGPLFPARIDVSAMCTPTKKKPNRNKTWRKYYNVIESFMCGSKKIEVLSCVWCEDKGDPFTLQSVRCRCVKHLERVHGWNEEMDIFDGRSVSLSTLSANDGDESNQANPVVESGTESTNGSSSTTTNDQIQIEIINDPSTSDSSQLNSTTNSEDVWKKYWEPAQTSVAPRKGPVLSCKLCSASDKIYELISCSKRCSRHLTVHHGWSASSDTFESEETSKLAMSSLKRKASSFSEIANASVNSPVHPSSSRCNSTTDIADGQSSKVQRLLTESENERAEYLLVAWAYSSNISFTAFDNPFWKEFLSLINDSVKAPTSQELNKKLDTGFELSIKAKRDELDE